jgi:SAM-dependent methyltransferase
MCWRVSADYEVWKSGTLARTFLDEVRGGVPCAAEQLDVMLRVVAGRGRPLDRFADLGCGGGALARAVLARFPDARATLLDVSEPMLAAARAALAGHAPAPRFVLADLVAPSWRAGVAGDAPFDAVLSGYAIHHLPDARKRTLYAEIFALLAPGGVFVNVEHVASPTAWIETLSDERLIDSIHAFQTGKGSDKSHDQVRDEFVHRPDKAANILAPVERQCEWLRAIGFADVDCYFKLFELAVFGGRRPDEPARPTAALGSEA